MLLEIFQWEIAKSGIFPCNCHLSLTSSVATHMQCMNSDAHCRVWTEVCKKSGKQMLQEFDPFVRISAHNVDSFHTISLFFLCCLNVILLFEVVGHRYSSATVHVLMKFSPDRKERFFVVEQVVRFLFWVLVVEPCNFYYLKIIPFLCFLN